MSEIRFHEAQKVAANTVGSIRAAINGNFGNVFIYINLWFYLLAGTCYILHAFGIV